MAELNPNHPTLNNVREQWGKMAAILIHKFGLTHVVVTAADIEAFANSGLCNITIQDNLDGIHLNLVDEATANALARKEGGLPH